MKPYCLIMAAALALVLAGCYPPKSGKGLHLPEGNVEKGKTAFVALQCHSCHKVEGVELPAPVSPVATNVVIGGKVTRIQSYGELVTCVVNPSHSLAPGFNKDRPRDGKLSPMPDYNETMTVSQLIDLVAFLQSRYEQIDPELY